MSPLVRKFGIGDGAIALTTALVFGGHRFYRKWEKEHLFEQDAGFVAKSDLRSATLCLQKILAADPNQLPATLLRPYSSSASMDRTFSPGAVASWNLPQNSPEYRIA